MGKLADRFSFNLMSIPTDFKLFVLPMQQPRTSKLEKPQPQVEYLENYVVVWLNYSMGKSRISQTSKSQLQQVVNSVKIFKDPEECHAFISGIKDEKIFVIVSGIVEEKFVSSIHDAKQLELIYVLSPDKEKYETWFNQYPEIRGIYTTILSLCEQLGKDVKKIDRTLLGFELIERSLSNSTSKTNQQDTLFMYDQLFRDIVLSVPDENMQDMYEFCEKQYRRNFQEQSFLKTFKQNYSSHSPVWWYTRESFLYRMLNKALRTHQYDILYLLRVFIRHLHEQIVEQQKKDNIDQKNLFRGQGMDKEDFDRLRMSEGGLLSISNFLSTSSDRKIGLQFAREALRDRKKVGILMEIRVDKNTVVPVADIADLSVCKTEQEWLFSMGSVFRIGSLECLDDGIWVVPLTLTDDQDEQLNALREHFKKSMADRNTCLNFAHLMHQLAAWRKSEYFYRMALETETTWQRRSALFNDLALIKGELGQYREALAYYQKSLELKGTAGSDSTSDKASTYNNIASLYYKQKKMDQAMKYFQKAIEACDTQGDNDEELAAALHANIATILNYQGKYEEALERCEESLKISIKIFPAIHPSLASTYGAIAITMHHMGLHAKAIEYAQKALDIDRQALPSDHPQTLLHMNKLEIFKQQQSD
jgi:tetratricopeptide (TPR) repeat protein